MPLVNDKYVDFDPEALADAVIAGKTVYPHDYDFENKDQRRARHQQEYEAISKALMKKDKKAWRKWHGIPEPENEFPYNEWRKLPMRNPGNLASSTQQGIETASAAPASAGLYATVSSAPLKDFFDALVMNGGRQTNLYAPPRKTIQDRINESDSLVNLYGV